LALTCSEYFSLKLPQKRHPERSASQLYRVTQRSGAESKDPGGADLTHAARSFSTTQAREQDSSCGTHLMVTGTSFHALYWRRKKPASLRICMSAKQVSAYGTASWAKFTQVHPPPTGLDLVMAVLTQTRKPSDRGTKTYSDQNVTHVSWGKMLVLRRTGAGRVFSEATQSKSDHQKMVGCPLRSRMGHSRYPAGLLRVHGKHR
jgi:hypothetical protein